MKLTVYEGALRHELPFTEGQTILDVLQNAGIRSVSAPCGGKGTCKKCTVFVRSEAFFGACLACTTPAKEGMSVELSPEVRISFADQSDGELYPPTPGQHGYAVACDLGTTTVILRLIDLETGALRSGLSADNSQRIFGADVLSRLKAAAEGRAAELHKILIRQVDSCIETLCCRENVAPEEIRRLSVAGNTILMHFFAGLDPSAISTAPFVPISLFGETKRGKELGLSIDADVYLCPAAAGLLGSDLLCGILSSKMIQSEKSALLIDLGANTEIALGNRDRILACAVDGGAAFKASLLENGMTASEGAISGVRYENGALDLEVLGGGAPKGICGSGFIDLLGILFEEELLDEMGRLAGADEADSPLARQIGEKDGRPVFFVTDDRKLFLSQADISKFQLAKAAIFAGIRILSEESGVSLSDLDRLSLGGGFGAFAHRRNAALLGMIPRECKGKTQKRGNLALAGAISAAISEAARSDLERIQTLVRPIDLPTHPSFSDAYTDGMFFE